jgi:Na+-driven multidrug efflux pump
MIGMWAFRVTGGYLLGVVLKMGLVGVWLAMYADWGVRAVLYFKRLLGNKWLTHNVISEETPACQPIQEP